MAEAKKTPTKKTPAKKAKVLPVSGVVGSSSGLAMAGKTTEPTEVVNKDLKDTPAVEPIADPLPKPEYVHDTFKHEGYRPVSEVTRKHGFTYIKFPAPAQVAKGWRLSITVLPDDTLEVYWLK